MLADNFNVWDEYKRLPPAEFSHDGFAAKVNYADAERAPQPVKRPEAILDIECYKNYFLVKFRSREPIPRYWEFPAFPGKLLDVAGIEALLRYFTVVTFNGLGYDMPMLSLALTGATCEQLKAASDHIIVGTPGVKNSGIKYWEFYDHYRVSIPDYVDHYDIMEVAPGVRISLKAYGGRMHFHTIQDLPIEPSADIGFGDRIELASYCGNDCDTTDALCTVIEEQCVLRENIGAKYNIDVRSKSDAQIAESIFKAVLGYKPPRRMVQHGFTFKYEPPSFLRFNSPLLRDVLHMVSTLDFVVNDIDQLKRIYGDAWEAFTTEIDAGGEKIKSGIQMPPQMKGLQIPINNSVYNMGIGGLHSTESARHVIACEHFTIDDFDVRSFYPIGIINSGREPFSGFRNVYKGMFDDRNAPGTGAKDRADAGKKLLKKMSKSDAGYDEVAHKLKTAKTESDAIKIILNGTYGKLGSKYSFLYAPEMLIQTTITGQLSLLMAIEMLESVGIPVISANTDGIVMCTPVSKVGARDYVLNEWQRITGFELEHTKYSAVFSRDVNSYVAITTDGEIKSRGDFAASGVIEKLHPDADVATDAAIAYVKDGTPLINTVVACEDMRRFVRLRSVSGGGVWGGAVIKVDGTNPKTGKPRKVFERIDGGQYLGKVVRFYYATGCEGKFINYKSNGNKVGNSEGSKPAMTLPAKRPDDVDFKAYVEIAREKLASVGVIYKGA